MCASQWYQTSLWDVTCHHFPPFKGPQYLSHFNQNILVNQKDIQLETLNENKAIQQTNEQQQIFRHIQRHIQRKLISVSTSAQCFDVSSMFRHQSNVSTSVQCDVIENYIKNYISASLEPSTGSVCYVKSLWQSFLQ